MQREKGFTGEGVRRERESVRREVGCTGEGVRRDSVRREVRRQERKTHQYGTSDARQGRKTRSWEPSGCRGVTVCRFGVETRAVSKTDESKSS